VPRRTVYMEIRWVSPAALSNYAFCPADQEILSRLMAGE